MVRCVALLAALGIAHAAPRLHYTFTPERGGLHIELKASRLPAAATLVRPASWGNAENLERCIRNEMSDGPGRLTYDLVQDWQGDLRESVRHRPHIAPGYIEFTPPNGLVYPRIPPEQVISVELEWRLPPGWSLATSFGSVQNARTHMQRFKGTMHDFVQAMFAAGDFRLKRHSVRGGEVVTAVRGQFAFTDAAFAERVLELIRYQRGFFRDHRFAYLVVTLAPFGRGQSGSGGGGFTNALNLHTAPETPLSTGLVSLIAHEIFHTWNPLRMGRIASPQTQTIWFSEGFTRYYQDLLLWQAGLMTREEYLDAVNMRIREHHLQQGSVGERLPRLGFLIALWLDERTSLDDLLRDLVKERKRRPVFDRRRLLDAIERHGGNAARVAVQAYLESDGPVPAPDRLRVHCAMRQSVEMHAFDLGMDRTELSEHRRVTRLQSGSAAERSGLREGDVVSGVSIYWNDPAKPVKLTVRGRKYEYLPKGRSLGVVAQYRCP